MLREIGKHDILFSFIRHKNVAGRLDDGFECTQGHHLGSISQHLVAEGSTLGARITKDSLGSFVLDELVVALENLEITKDSELHSGAGLFAAGLAVAPDGQGGFSRHLAFEGAAHASPVASRHDE